MRGYVPNDYSVSEHSKEGERKVLTCNLETSDRPWWGLGASVQVDMSLLSVMEKPQDYTIMGMVSVFYFPPWRINCRVVEWWRGRENEEIRGCCCAVP